MRFFCKQMNEKEKELKEEKIRAEWNHFKYFVNETTKPKIPAEISGGKTLETPTSWLLNTLLGNKPQYVTFFPCILKLAEIALTLPVSNACTLPVSNAWPERGCSALKLVKNRLRNRMKNDVLDTLLHVKINGPPVAK